MGVAKKVRKFAQVKRVIGKRDSRRNATLKPTGVSRDDAANKTITSPQKRSTELVREIPQAPHGLFFQSNDSLGPPYNVILDTNFFAHAVRNKLDILENLMDLLLATCHPVVTDCTIAELEKLGQRYRLALRTAKDERWQRLRWSHSGTYADDCILSTVVQHRCYLVGTNDRQLRQRLRRVPGVPLVAVGKGKFTVERLPGGVD